MGAPAGRSACRSARTSGDRHVARQLRQQIEQLPLGGGIVQGIKARALDEYRSQQREPLLIEIEKSAAVAARNSAPTDLPGALERGDGDMVQPQIQRERRPIETQSRRARDRRINESVERPRERARHAKNCSEPLRLEHRGRGHPDARSLGRRVLAQPAAEIGCDQCKRACARTALPPEFPPVSARNRLRLADRDDGGGTREHPTLAAQAERAVIEIEGEDGHGGTRLGRSDVGREREVIVR
jgi:hypothetical protein